MCGPSGQPARPFWVALVAGGCAGTTVDVALFPIDTIKTRLQAPEGFLRAGGFKGVYNGLSSAAAGSAPGAAIFFCAYESAKSFLTSNVAEKYHSGCYILASSLAETAACLVRVPTDNIKQKIQVNPHRSESCPALPIPSPCSRRCPSDQRPRPRRRGAFARRRRPCAP